MSQNLPQSFFMNQEQVLRPALAFAPIGPKRFKCPRCPERFSSSALLHPHLKTHKDYLHCTHCKKKLSCIASLVSHVYTHTGEKPYKCVLCPKRFTTKFNLKIHIISCQKSSGNKLSVLELKTLFGEHVQFKPRVSTKKRKLDKNDAGIADGKDSRRKRKKKRRRKKGRGHDGGALPMAIDMASPEAMLLAMMAPPLVPPAHCNMLSPATYMQPPTLPYLGTRPQSRSDRKPTVKAEPLSPSNRAIPPQPMRGPTNLAVSALSIPPATSPPTGQGWPCSPRTGGPIMDFSSMTANSMPPGLREMMWRAMGPDGMINMDMSGAGVMAGPPVLPLAASVNGGWKLDAYHLTLELIQMDAAERHFTLETDAPVNYTSLKIGLLSETYSNLLEWQADLLKIWDTAPGVRSRHQGTLPNDAKQKLQDNTLRARQIFEYRRAAQKGLHPHNRWPITTNMDAIMRDDQARDLFWRAPSTPTPPNTPIKPGEESEDEGTCTSRRIAKKKHFTRSSSGPQRMDLQTVVSKIKNREYITVKQWASDIKKILDDAGNPNIGTTQEANAAARLRRVLEKSLRESQLAQSEKKVPFSPSGLSPNWRWSHVRDSHFFEQSLTRRRKMGLAANPPAPFPDPPRGEVTVETQLSALEDPRMQLHNPGFLSAMVQEWNQYTRRFQLGPEIDEAGLRAKVQDLLRREPMRRPWSRLLQIYGLSENQLHTLCDALQKPNAQIPQDLLPVAVRAVAVVAAKHLRSKGVITVSGDGCWVWPGSLVYIGKQLPTKPRLVLDPGSYLVLTVTHGKIGGMMNPTIPISHPLNPPVGQLP